MSELRDRVAIVTGGSNGIGLAISQELDRRGAQVVVASRGAERNARAVESLERGVGFGGCDVRERASIDALFDFVDRTFGRVDIVVASAGIGRGSDRKGPVPPTVVQLDEEEWDEVVDTNLRGIFMLCRAAAGRMVAQGEGQIVNISSARGALRGQPCGSGYCASKMGVLAMFHALAQELAPLGVRAVSLLPDAVDTSLIAGTTLAPRGAMAPGRVADLVAELLELPMDATFSDPLIGPWNHETLTTP